MNPKVSLICENCKELFYVKKYREKIARFCSIKCRAKIVMGCYKYWEGKKHYKSTKEKISRATSKEKHYRWLGGRRVDWEGYVLVYKPKHLLCNDRGFIREHRFIVEQEIGRYLNKNEEVHHIDKNKENNNPKNLMCFTSKSAHRRFELGKSKVYNNEIIFDGREYEYKSIAHC